MHGKRFKQLLYIISVILMVGIAAILIINGRHYFTRRGLREIQLIVRSYGVLSPLIVVLLICLSNIIPPFPIPTPLIEMVVGLLYGFWPGFVLVWISQIVSSGVAFVIARFVGKHIFKNFLSNRIFAFFRAFLDREGSIAVFILRFTLSSPFSAVSYLAGFTQINFLKFFTATVLGTASEAALFPFIGSILRQTRLRLWYVYILVVILSTAVGPVLTFLIVKIIAPRLRTKK